MMNAARLAQKYSGTNNMKNNFKLHNFQSKIIRAQIKLFMFFLGFDCPIPILPIRFADWGLLIKFGPSFAYKHDEIIWLWKDRKWMSLDCGGMFDTIEKVDSFWVGYDETLDNLINDKKQ